MTTKTLILSALILSACGGGGGGSDGDACERYCNFACAKIVNCGFLNHSQGLDCNSACFARTGELERSEESCENAQRSVQQMTCSQLGRTIGVARVREPLSCEDIALIIADQEQWG